MHHRHCTADDWGHARAYWVAVGSGYWVANICAAFHAGDWPISPGLLQQMAMGSGGCGGAWWDPAGCTAAPSTQLPPHSNRFEKQCCPVKLAALVSRPRSLVTSRRMRAPCRAGSTTDRAFSAPAKIPASFPLPPNPPSPPRCLPSPSTSERPSPIVRAQLIFAGCSGVREHWGRSAALQALPGTDRATIPAPAASTSQPRLR